MSRLPDGFIDSDFYEFENLPASAILRGVTVRRLTKRSATLIYEGIEKGRFPAPIKLGAEGRGAAVGWRVGDIRAWLKEPTKWRACSSPGKTGASEIVDTISHKHRWGCPCKVPIGGVQGPDGSRASLSAPADAVKAAQLDKGA